MRKKMLLCFLAGILVTIVSIWAIKTLTPTARAEPTGSESTITDDETSVRDLIQILQQARCEISDPETLAYYEKLVAQYDLENTPTNGIPDIKNIQYTAITLPLQEAGKTIKDPDLKNFYYRYLEQSGLNSGY